MKKFNNPLSVIIVSNSFDEKPQLLIEKLCAQLEEYQGSELIVVFNGPKSDFRSQVQGLKNLRSFYINEESPYEARNLGVQAALNSQLVFLDSDCVPANDWLSNVFKITSNCSFDLGVGAVIFESPKSSAALYDSIAFLQTKDCCRLRNVALTLNLITHKKVFKKIGFFDSTTVSGADVEWSKQASLNGFSLQYLEDVKITHPCRTLFPLLKKAIRVGKGKSRVGWNLLELFSTVQFKLLNPFYFKLRISSHTKATFFSALPAYFVGMIVMGLSLCSYLVSGILMAKEYPMLLLKKKALQS